jgi:hypothetical protein
VDVKVRVKEVIDEKSKVKNKIKSLKKNKNFLTKEQRKHLLELKKEIATLKQ